MTREEAINYLTSTGLTEEQVMEVVEALKQQTCEDAVSRNLIIQTLNKMDRYVADELMLCDTDKKFPKNEVFIVDDVYEQIVEQLPSVQPEQRTGHWIDIGSGQECSECGEIQYGYDSFRRYCANCGAKMEVQDGISN